MSEWSEMSRAAKAGRVTFWVLMFCSIPISVPVWLCLRFVRI